MKMTRRQRGETTDSIHILDGKESAMHASAMHDEAKVGIQTLDKHRKPVGKLVPFNDVE